MEVAIEGLCRGLRAGGGDDRFVVAHRAAYAVRGLASAALTTLAAPVWANGRAGRILWERACLPAALRAAGAQVLHAPGYILPAGWRGPSLLTVYDILALSHPEWCKWANAAYFRRALPPSIGRATITVTPSEHVRQEIIARLCAPPDRVRVVPLGLPAEMTPSRPAEVMAARQVLGVPERYLLWVGNFEPKKNLEGIVEAFEHVAANSPHSLVLAGKPGWKCEPILRRIAASPVAGRILMPGYVPPLLLPPLMTGADLLVHWSLYEGAGLTPLEAMACGTPAVVSDGGALPELAGQVAPVVPLGDPGALADEITSLLTDRARHDALAARGREWVAQFTWRRHADAMIALYAEAASIAEEA